MTLIPNVIGAHGTISKGLVKGLGDFEMKGKAGNMNTTVFLNL